MTRLGCALALSVLLLASIRAAGPTDQRFMRALPADKRIVHALDRLTFGPRSTDFDRVRRMGVDKWIDLQLHPDRIVENPALDVRLARLGTLHLTTWQLLEKYPAVPPALMVRPPSAVAFASLPQQQSVRLLNGSVEERRATLATLDPETRRLVLAGAPPQVLDGLSDDLREEASMVRKTEQEDRQKQLRRLMPPANELLTPDELRTANRGTPEQKRALLDAFDPEKRRQVLRALPIQAWIDLPDIRREAMGANQPQQFVNAELVEQKLYRAIDSNQQLEEILVDFWMNHFNVFNGKGPGRVLLTSFEREAIRPYVFGRFRDMLLATARHPAMLFYLDNWLSQAPREDLPPLPPGARRPGLNENYGRELMELHTLGVNGGYTQDDVVAVARAFTGWTIYDPQKFAEFQFNPAVHDRKEKLVLGHTIPAMGGEQDGVQVIALLAQHPSTARFISKKLAQRFVADDPPSSLVDKMAATFTRTDGDLRAVLQTMFSSREFFSEGAWRTKMKSPLELVVSAVRAVNADVTDTFALAQRIADLGEPLYGKLEPTGYPNTGDAWTSTASVLGRINFATALVGGQIPGVRVDSKQWNVTDPAALAHRLLGLAPSPSTLAAITNTAEGGEATPQMLATLVMGSPDFQRR